MISKRKGFARFIRTLENGGVDPTPTPKYDFSKLLPHTDEDTVGFVEEVLDGMCTSIDGCFSWVDTPQGDAHWGRVYSGRDLSSEDVSYLEWFKKALIEEHGFSSSSW